MQSLQSPNHRTEISSSVPVEASPRLKEKSANFLQSSPDLHADSSPHSQRPSVPGTIVSLGAPDTGATIPPGFQRHFLIWGFLPGAPLLGCFCVSWNLNLHTSVCPSVLGCLALAAELGSRSVSLPARRRSAGQGLCAWFLGSLELPNVQRV